VAAHAASKLRLIKQFGRSFRNGKAGQPEFVGLPGPQSLTANSISLAEK
jgi:hypothetical protein